MLVPIGACSPLVYWSFQAVHELLIFLVLIIIMQHVKLTFFGYFFLSW
jgi:hypothetical protein